MEPKEESDHRRKDEDEYERPAHIIEIPSNPPKTTESHDVQGNRPKKISKPWWHRWLRKFLAPVGLFTLAIVVFSGLQALYTKRQSDNMDGQLGVMRGQLKQMLEDDKRAERIVAASEGIKASMAEAVQNYSTAAKDALAEQRKALAATLAQGKASLDASIAATQLDQRAWIGLKKIDVEVVRETTGDIDILFTNTGRSPALDVRTVTFMEWIPPTQKPKFLYTEKDSTGAGVLVPGAEMFGGISDPKMLTPATIDAIKAGSLKFYVSGSVWYRDIFGNRRVTHFCTRYEPKATGAERGSFTFCQEHNSAN